MSEPVMTEQVQVRALVPERGVDVELQWPVGDTLALVGQNGSGKSTTVDVLAGAIREPGCAVSIASRDLTCRAPHQRGLGYLEQRALLFPHLTALRNVEFGLRAQRRRGRPTQPGSSRSDSAGPGTAEPGTASSASIRERARLELQAVGCADLADRRPHQLSGGQAQRIALARALATDPELVLLDEPLAALDASLAPELRRLLAERLRGTTTLLVTHDLLDVLTLADRVAVVDEGRVAAVLSVRELLSHPPTAFAAEFAGTNLLVGTALGDRLTVPPDAITLHRSLHRDPGAELNGAPVPRSAPQAQPIIQPAAETALHGTVQSVDQVGRVVLARVQTAGQTLRAEISPQRLLELDLAPGDPVVAILDPARVTVH